VSQPAQADHIYEGDYFSGGWFLSNQRQGDIILGNGNGRGLSLGSTERYCNQPGSGYSTMRRYIESNYPDQVSWFVDRICTDGYVRVCVYAYWGDLACSTFADFGWVRLD
jgi:hypothetical protein